MRNLILATAIVLLIAPSCKKKDSGGLPAGVGFSLDGSNLTLNFTRAVKSSSGSIYTLQFYGFVGAQNASNELEGQIQAQSPITAKAYTEGGATESAGLAYFIYSPYSVFQNTGSTTNPVTITITSITSTNVQGTFKGDISDGTTTKVVANGTFNINF
jgi:hypothetical protein